MHGLSPSETLRAAAARLRELAAQARYAILAEVPIPDDLVARLLAAIEREEQLATKERDDPASLHSRRKRGTKTLLMAAAHRLLVEKLVYYGTDPSADPTRRDRSRSDQLLAILAEGYGLSVDGQP